MAKSARSSRTKAHRANLRTNIFNPAANARAERLSHKLMEVVSQPKPERPEKPEKMEVDSAEPKQERPSKLKKKPLEEVVGDDMEIDEDTAGAKVIRKKTTRKTPSRIQKKRRGKPHAQVIFPSIRKRQSRKAEKKSKG